MDNRNSVCRDVFGYEIRVKKIEIKKLKKIVDKKKR